MSEVAIPVPDRMPQEIVAALVERYLEKFQPVDYRLVVNRQAIIRGPSKWLVEINVEPKGAQVSAADVSDRIVAANMAIECELPRYIFLSSLVPRPGEVL